MTHKRPFTMNYKTYDTSQGFGNVSQWSAAFNDTMGADEAKVVLQNDNPLSIMGLSDMPSSLNELKKVYRGLMMIHHPDRGGDAETCKKIIAAYSVLEVQFH